MGIGEDSVINIKINDIGQMLPNRIQKKKIVLEMHRLQSFVATKDLRENISLGK